MKQSSAKLWRLFFALFKLTGTVIALILVMGGIALYATEPMSLLIPQDSLVTLLAGGSLTALIFFLSFLVVGVRKRTDGARGARLRWIVLDALVMAALATGFILSALAALRQAQTLNSSTRRKFSEFWESASPMIITLIQKEGQCCGFDGYTDRVLEPCKRYSEAVGCWTVLRDQYGYYLHIFTPSLFILASLCAAASIFASILLLVRFLSKREGKNSLENGSGHEIDESFRINRSQPFDAWHKAVFTS